MADTTIGKLVYLITGDNSGLNKSLNASEKKVQKFGEGATNVGKKLTVGLTLPLVAIGIASLKTASSFETQQVAFQKLLGSVDKGNKLFEQLKQFSATTPLQLEDINKGAKRLLAFGIAQEDIIEKMRRLGDASLGNAATLDRLTLAYGKLKSKGRATLEEINLFTEAGVPLMDALAKQFNISTKEVFKYVETGKIGFEDVDKALTTLTDTGGKFNGIMEAISQTAEGKLSTALDNIKLAAASLGVIILPTFKKILDSVISAAKWFGDLDTGTKELIIKIGAFLALLGPLALGIGKVALAVKLLGASFLGPVGIIVGVVAAGTAIIHFSGILQDFEDVQKDLVSSTEDLKKSNDDYKQISEELEDPLKKLNKQETLMLKNRKAIAKLGIVERLEKLAKGYKKLSLETIKGANATRQIGVRSDIYKIKLEAVNKKVAEYSKLTKDQQKNIKDVGKITASYNNTILELGSTYSTAGGLAGKLFSKTVSYTDLIELQTELLKSQKEVERDKTKSTITLTGAQEASLGIIKEVARATIVLGESDANLLIENEELAEAANKLIELYKENKTILDDDTKSTEKNTVALEGSAKARKELESILEKLRKKEAGSLENQLKGLLKLRKLTKEGTEDYKLLSEEISDIQQQLLDEKGLTKQQELLKALGIDIENLGAKGEGASRKIEKGIGDTISNLADLTSQGLGKVFEIIQAIQKAREEDTQRQIEQESKDLEKRLSDIDIRLQAELEAKGLLEETEKEKLERELAAAKIAGNQTVIDEKEKALARLAVINNFEKEKSAAEAESLKKTEALQKQAALQRYEAELSQAKMSAASAQLAAISAGIGSAPFPYNLIITGALQTQAAILSGIQISAIKKNKPQFEDGARNIPRDMDAVVHRGEMIIPRPFADEVRSGNVEISDVTTGQGAGAGKNIVIQLVAQGEGVIWEKALDASKNGQLLLDKVAIVGVG